MTRDPREEIDEELRFHLDERIQEYIAHGMTPEAARRAATARLGDLGRVRRICASLLSDERASENRRTLVRVSWLDVKLGLRMFVKYPGLSLVSVLGMAVAIAIGAGYFTVMATWLDASLPLPEGDRIVSIRKLSVTGSSLSDASGPDFLQWRDELTAVRDLGAFRDQPRNLTADGRTDVVHVAVMSASGFRLARIAPIMGRTLTDEDERAGAPRVVVIRADEWQQRFGGDPRILERSLRLDDAIYDIVGVMPEGFGFPVNYRYWVALAPPQDVGDDRLRVFGRLADGFALKDARAEVAAVGDRMAVASPKTHGQRRPVVLPYTHAFVGIQGPEMELVMRGVQYGVGLLLLVVAVNVAILVYARTATRIGEITVRTALGASRARVVAQLFVEALVPSVAAAALGLVILHVAFTLLRAALAAETDGAARLPSLVDFRLSPGVIAYVTLLAILAAVISGVLPALKATGRRVLRGLQQFSVRGSGVQLGPTWTTLIVLQVAVAVAALPGALFNGAEFARLAARRPAPAAHGLMRATLAWSRDAPGLENRLPALTPALTQRLEAHPSIAAVTYAARFPGEERWETLEVEGRDERIDVRTNDVAANLFDVFEVPVVAGRGFGAVDTHAEATAVIVDDTFVRRLGGGNVLGQRVRYARSADGETPPSAWFEIVGVVSAFADDFSAGPQGRETMPRLFHPAAHGQDQMATLVLRIGATVSPQLAANVRQIAATVDPALRVEDARGVVEVWDDSQRFRRLMAVAILTVTGSVLLLSAAGIYSMMSFTVARRRREIGIRTALGADARRVLVGIFRRAATQIGAGILVGLAVASALDVVAGGEVMGGHAALLLPLVAAMMAVVGLLAALGPARRGLAVQPTEALRDE